MKAVTLLLFVIAIGGQCVLGARQLRGLNARYGRSLINTFPFNVYHAAPTPAPTAAPTANPPANRHADPGGYYTKRESEENAPSPLRPSPFPNPYNPYNQVPIYHQVPTRYSPSSTTRSYKTWTPFSSIMNRV